MSESIMSESNIINIARPTSVRLPKIINVALTRHQDKASAARGIPKKASILIKERQETPLVSSVPKIINVASSSKYLEPKRRLKMGKVDKCVQILREQEEQIKDLKFRVKKLKHKNRALEIKMQGNQQVGSSADNNSAKATVYLPKLTDACIRKYTTTSIHKKTQYHCEKCDKSLSTKGNLKLHVKSVHDSVRYNCDKCDKSFSQKGHLNEHVKTFHENVRYSCDKCNKSYIHKTNLTAHIKSVHENIRHYCDKCDKSFTWKSALNTHIQIVHENVLYNCDKCDKSFSLKTHLKQHMKKVH